MAYINISYQKKDQIGCITLDRPDKGNLINDAMADELADCCNLVNQDEEVRVVIITGSGNVFCSGVDDNDTIAPGFSASAIASIKCPVIAAINGDAIGAGLELALTCDLRLSSDSAKFGLPEVSTGSIPSGGGTQRLPRIVGRGKAMEMILTAVAINADEAWQIGLINQVIPLTELSKTSDELAKKIASKGPISERYAKEAISKGMDMTLGQGLGLEADLSFLLQSTSDRTEGINAFNEKRTPEFEGK